MAFRKTPPLPHLASIAFAACVLPSTLYAQIAGELKGRVTDATGDVVAGAHVTLTQSATGVQQSSVTTSDGYYDFAQLVSGTYTIQVQSAGFAPYTHNGITGLIPQR